MVKYTHAEHQNLNLCMSLSDRKIFIVVTLLDGHLRKFHFGGFKQKIESHIHPGLKDDHIV